MQFSLRKLFAVLSLMAIVLAVISIGRSSQIGPTVREIRKISFSQDGRTLGVVALTARDAQVRGKRYVDQESTSIVLLDAASLSKCNLVWNEVLVGPHPMERAGWQIAFAPDRKYLYCLIHSGDPIRKWDIASQKWSYDIVPPNGIVDFTLSSNGAWLATADLNGMTVQNSQTGEVLTQSNWGWPIKFSDDGRTLAFAKRGELQIWDLTEKKLRQTYKYHFRAHDRRPSIAVSPDGHDIVLGSDEGLSLYNTDSSEGRSLHTGLAGPVQSRFEQANTFFNMTFDVAFSPDGNLVAACGEYGVALFDANNGVSVCELTTSHTTCLAFSADGKMLATGGRDGKLKLWDLSTKKQKVSVVLDDHFCIDK